MTHGEEVIARIREMWANPQNTAVLIGQRLGVSDDSVRKIAIRKRRVEGLEIWPIKPSHPPHHPDTIAAVKRLWRAFDGSAADIAYELGLTRCTVIGIVYRGRELEGSEEWPNRTTANGPQVLARRARRLADGRPAPRQRPAPKPAPARPVALPLPTEGLVRWADMKFRGQCKYIWSSYTADPELMVCGRPVEGEGSWCPAHRLLTYAPRPRKVTNAFAY